MQKNKSEKFWDKVSKFHDNVAINKTFKKTIELTKKYLKPTDNILDFGCATGLYSIELAKYVKSVHGIDISSKMIDAAKNKALKNTKFTKASINDKLGKYDVVLAFNVLHFIEKDISKIIDQLLSPGGGIYFYNTLPR